MTSGNIIKDVSMDYHRLDIDVDYIEVFKFINREFKR